MRPFTGQYHLRATSLPLTGIQLTSGGTICLRGADNYDSLRGQGPDFLILDEFEAR
jgi:hypothetical protein